MPTDEQRMREAFEKPFYSLGHGEQLSRNSTGFYQLPNVQDEWRGFQDGHHSRDAEVQALQAENQQLRQALADVNFGDVQPDERDAEVQTLREALKSIADMYHSFSTPNAFHALGEAKRTARAALAGGETGETE